MIMGEESVCLELSIPLSILGIGVLCLCVDILNPSVPQRSKTFAYQSNL